MPGWLRIAYNYIAPSDSRYQRFEVSETRADRRYLLVLVRSTYVFVHQSSSVPPTIGGNIVRDVDRSSFVTHDQLLLPYTADDEIDDSR